MTETIFALATPPGVSGVAVVRVSGTHAFDSVRALTGKNFLPRVATFTRVRIVDSNNMLLETIDRALILPFPGPSSFTGEDIVEYHVHGSRAVIQSLLGALALQPGHRMAEPGEFTRRAFDNDKIDLTEAEGLADLINAQTQAQKTQALSQMEGTLSRLYTGWANALKKMLAHLEADLEFPDEDMPDGILPHLQIPLQDLIADIATHLADNRRGERLRDGIKIAVIGAPNAGKSSLVNAIAQRDIAIVSTLAGTTRDVIEAHLDLGGYPVTIADTAGLRPELLTGDGHEAIETEGIRRALITARDADIKILLFDATQSPDAATMALADQTSLLVFNKIDQASPDVSVEECFFISVKTGAGMATLMQILLERISGLVGPLETPSVTRQRYRVHLAECMACLQRALTAPLPELTAEDLRLAVRALGRITGRVDVEDLLDVIFRDFCIGK